MGKNSKRPKSHYINMAKRKRKNELEPGMKGFLCTTNMREKECVKEAYNILNEYANILYENKNLLDSSKNENETVPSEKKPEISKQNVDTSDSESEDIEAAIKNEVAALQSKNQESCKDRSRFQQVFVRVNNCIFISTSVDNPVELSLSIMDSIMESKKVKTKHLVKLLPVQNTCKAFLEDIIKASKELLLEYLPKEKIKFYISFRARNNNSIDRELLYKNLSNIITEYNIEAIADYKTPDVVVNVDIVKNICCLSILPYYMTKYCKYNLIKLAEDQEDKKEDKIKNAEAVVNESENLQCEEIK